MMALEAFLPSKDKKLKNKNKIKIKVCWVYPTQILSVLKENTILSSLTFLINIYNNSQDSLSPSLSWLLNSVRRTN